MFDCYECDLKVELFGFKLKVILKLDVIFILFLYRLLFKKLRLLFERCFLEKNR